MNCQEFRAAVGAEPQRSDAAIEAHAGGCDACAAWRREMQRMDAVMRRALAIDIDAARAGGKATAQQPAWRGWALAASVACATLVAGLLWLALPRTALADEVVAHLSEEPDAWAATRLAADPARVAQVLARSGVRLASDAGLVSYAHSCLFRGNYVPHLVFQTHAGPVTVMVLTDEPHHPNPQRRAAPKNLDYHRQRWGLRWTRLRTGGGYQRRLDFRLRPSFRSCSRVACLFGGIASSINEPCLDI